MYTKSRFPPIEYQATTPRSGRGDAVIIIGTVLSLLSAIYIVASLCALWPEQWAGVVFSDYKWRYLLTCAGVVGGLCLVGYGWHIRNRPALFPEGTTVLWGVLTVLACTVVACVSVTFDNWWIAGGFVGGAMIGVVMIVFGDRGPDHHVPDDAIFVDAVAQGDKELLGDPMSDGTGNCMRCGHYYGPGPVQKCKCPPEAGDE